MNEINSLEGTILLVDKPLQMTSHDVVAITRKKTGLKRVGHAGTLDPLATGLLIILVGRSATKRQSEFMAQDKEYIAELTFGSTSETYDAEGPFKQTATSNELQQLSIKAIKKVLPSFIGNIVQRPPAYSAIKIGGQPMYKKARQGKINHSEIPPRQITIHSIDILNFTKATNSTPPTLQLRVACEKGTYIRSLAHDIGKAVHTGAYLSGLRRTKIGKYSVEDAISLDQIPTQ